MIISSITEVIEPNMKWAKRGDYVQDIITINNSSFRTLKVFIAGLCDCNGIKKPFIMKVDVLSKQTKAEAFKILG